MHPITVWRFECAPQDLQELSTNGGDEDWLIEIPPGYGYMGMNESEASAPDWVDRLDSCGEPLSFPHPRNTGWLVAICCHA